MHERWTLSQLALVTSCLVLAGSSLPVSAQGYGSPQTTYPTNPPAPNTKWPELDRQAQDAYKKEDYVEAERLWREAVTEANADQQIEPGLVQLLIKLAWLKDKTGDIPESERLYEFATRTMESLGGKENPRYCDFLPGLAELFNKHGRPDRAELTYKDLVSMREKAAPPNHSKQAAAYDEYAKFLRGQGRPEDATFYETKATTVRLKLQEDAK